MMRKKVALTAAAVVMVGTLAVGGTLAWFTDTETATNVVTMGNVDITLSEDGKDDGEVIGDGLKYDGILPGDVFDKLVTIGVEDNSNSAYVRAKIIVTGTAAELLLDEDEENDITFGAAAPLEWKLERIEDDDCAVAYINKGAMEPGDDWTVFTSIEIPGSWGNEYEDMTFNVKVVAEAIQQANLTEEEAYEAMSVNLDLNKNESTDAEGSIVASSSNAAEE